MTETFTDEQLEERFLEEFPLFFMEMNEPQEKFIRCRNSSGRTPRRRLLEAGNKVGKCITYDTLVDTVGGSVSVGKLYKMGRPFKVYTWDGEKKVIAWASAPFKKTGVHKCYEISFSDGTVLCAADYHRVLTDKGWLFFQHLYEYFQDLQESRQESYFSIHPSNVIHLSERQLNYLSGYHYVSRLYGERPLSYIDSGQDVPPLVGDVPEHNQPWLQKDALVYKHRHIPYGLLFRLSNLCDLNHFGGRFFEFLTYIYDRFSRLFQHVPQFSLLPSTVGAFQFQSYNEYLLNLSPKHNVFSHKPPINKYCNKIVSCNLIGSQEVFDFEVKEYHNYFAGGLINHNTQIGISEDIAHALGYRPWLDENDPDFKVDVKVPNSGLIACETIQHSIAEKIEPLLRKLIPRTCKPVFKPGPTGVLSRVRLREDGRGNKCNSVIYLRSFDSRPDTYEGIDSDWIHYDEPPPEKHLEAAERGKVASNAPSWFTMTPLKESHIYDKFTVQAPFDEEIDVIRGSMWDNCRDYCRKCDLTIEENFPQRNIKECPSCGKVLGFLSRTGIEEYLKTLDPEVRETREFGTWKHLSGLVYKELDRDFHLYEDFQIPPHWTRIEAVDPHDAKPTCWLYGAISPEEIQIFGKTKHRIYFYDYLLLTGSVEDMVRKIKSTRELHGYSEPLFVVIDAKFGEKTQMEGKSWEGELRNHGISRIRLSQSKPGDVDLGHKIVREYLKKQYSSLLGKEKPGMLFAKDKCSGRNGPIHHMFSYQWKENKDEPEKEFKHWPDAVRYVALEQPEYRSPEGEKQRMKTIVDRMQNIIETRRQFTS